LRIERQAENGVVHGPDGFVDRVRARSAILWQRACEHRRYDGSHDRLSIGVQCVQRRVATGCGATRKEARGGERGDAENAGGDECTAGEVHVRMTIMLAGRTNNLIRRAARATTEGS
jgi:hypothetical protein